MLKSQTGPRALSLSPSCWYASPIAINVNMTSPFSFLSLFPQKGKEISILFLLYSLYWLAPGREQQDKRERLILPLSRTSLSSWAAGFVSMEHAEIPEALKPRDDLHQPIDLPVHSSTDSPQQKYGDRHNSSDPLRRGRRASGGSDRSVEQSSLHRNQAKGSWERKGASEGAQGVAPSTPGRFKTRAGGQGDESPDKGPAVPKFGEWDENNPSSADGFTGIFNKVREEKQTESAKVPHITDDSVYLNSYGHGSSNYKSSGCLCFRWRKK